MKDRHSRKSFRIGPVRGGLRGKVWYLTYHENGSRRRPRVGARKQSARQLAAQINSQLEVGVPSAMSFEPISIVELQQHWLQHHEQALRSSVYTINRYRSATGPLAPPQFSAGQPLAADTRASSHNLKASRC